MQSLELGELSYAGLAPSGPEVEQQRLPFPGLQPNLCSVRKADPKIR